MAKNIIILLLFTIISSTVSLLGQSQPRPAIDFTLTSTEGLEVNLFEEMENQKTVLLNFFYTDCGNCVLDAPIFDSIYQQFGSGTEELLVWGIANPYSSDEEIVEFIQETEITYPCFPTHSSDDVFSLYDILYTPQIYIICNYEVSESISHFEIIENLNYCFPTKINKIEMYPEIFSKGNKLYINNILNEKTTATIYDITGRLINKEIIPAKQNIIINNLKTNNMYIINLVSQNGEKQTKKILLR